MKKVLTTKNKQLLEEMLQLRRDGWSYRKLAKKYGLDHTSIMYHCHKYLTKKECSRSNTKYKLKAPTKVKLPPLPKAKRYKDYLNPN